MKFRPQLKIAAWGVSLALVAASLPASLPAYAGGWGAPAQGDSGQGVDTVIGNGLNPRGLDTTTQPDDNGLGPFRAPVAHTPTGAQYSVPWVEPTDPSFYGNVEFGFIGSFGDANAAKFDEYRDFSGITGHNNGLTINNFNFGAEKEGHYFNFFGGGVGNTDQYYGGAIGSYNDWRLRFFYNETPHIFTTTMKSIFNESTLGTGYMSLKSALAFTGQSGTNGDGVTNTTSQTPNSTTINQTIRNVINNSPDTTVALYRKKGGLRYDMTLNDKWSFYSSYSVERRTGDRPWGQTGGGFPAAAAAASGTVAANGQPVEMVEPIDYTTHEVAEGLSFVNEKNALNLAFTASVFQDGIKQVYWENPYDSPYTSAVTGEQINRHVQQFTTPPDNQAYYIKGDYTRWLSFWNSSLSFNGSYGWLNQNDQLQTTVSSYEGSSCLATVATGCSTVPAANAVTGVYPTTGGPVDNMAYWDSLYGPNGLPTLSRLTSQLRNTTYVANFAWNAMPIDRLSIGLKARFYGYKDNNDYLACNPSLAAAYKALGYGDGTCNPATNTTVPIFGFVVEDGNFVSPVASTQNGAGLGGKVRSMNTTNTQQNYALTGDYALTSKISLNANIEQENVYRAERERDWTYETKFKFGLVDRNLGAGTLRASYEYDNRTGSAYKYDPYAATYCAIYYTDSAICDSYSATGGAGVGQGAVTAAGIYSPTATANPLLGTKYDLSDRIQNVFVVRYNYMFTETLDAMLTGKLNHQNYPDPLGRGNRNEHNVSAELNWTPDTLTNAYASVTYEGMQQSQSSVAAYYSNCTSLPCSYVLGGTNSYFGAIASTTTGNTAFTYKSDDKDWYFNLGVNHKFAAVRVSADYTFTYTKSPIDYSGYNYATGVVGTATVLSTAATQFSFPDMVWNRHQLNLSATMPINDKLAIRAMYMLDRAIVKDWHYDGLAGYSNEVNGRYYIDSGDATSYVAQVVGIFLQYRM